MVRLWILFIMLDFANFNFENKVVGIVAHDAGAANHLIAWIANGRFSSANLKLSFHGPALVSARELLPEFVALSVKELVSLCSVLIVGTGWQTDIEYNAVKIAHDQSIPVIAVLDHWTNYKQRFIRNNLEILPDYVWVVDRYAEASVTKYLPRVSSLIMPNDYLTSQVELVNSYENISSAHKKILFLMEPIRQQWGPLEIEGEMLSFNYLIDNIKLLEINEFIEIVIRPHPSDANGKYSHLLMTNNKLSISVSSKVSLAEQLAWSDLVVGCQTYAMIIALAVNKTVVSAIPASKPRCILPHSDIIHLSKLVEDYEIL
jgi:hypothetical protein